MSLHMANNLIFVQYCTLMTIHMFLHMAYNVIFV